MDNKVISNNVPHVHGPLSEEEIKMFDVIAEAKTKAVEQPDEKPLHIIATSMKNNFESVPEEIKNKDLSNLRQAIYGKRRRTFKPVPKQRRACLQKLKEMAGEDDDLVRKVKGSVVMIARKNDLQLLNTAKVDMFGDGTFKYSPRFFSQMYSFFCVQSRILHPCGTFSVNKQISSNL